MIYTYIQIYAFSLAHSQCQSLSPPLSLSHTLTYTHKRTHTAHQNGRSLRPINGCTCHIWSPRLFRCRRCSLYCMCVCVCVCVCATFDFLDFFDADGVQCLYVCVCVCVRAIFELLDFFDAEGVLCACVCACVCAVPYLNFSTFPMQKVFSVLYKCVCVCVCVCVCHIWSSRFFRFRWCSLRCICVCVCVCACHIWSSRLFRCRRCSVYMCKCVCVPYFNCLTFLMQKVSCVCVCMCACVWVCHIWFYRFFRCEVFCVYTCVYVCVFACVLRLIFMTFWIQKVFCVCERAYYVWSSQLFQCRRCSLYMNTHDEYTQYFSTICVYAQWTRCTPWVHTILLNWPTNTAAYRMSISDLRGGQMKTLHTMNTHHIPQLAHKHCCIQERSTP